MSSETEMTEAERECLRIMLSTQAARSWQLAKKMRCPTDRARRILLGMERKAIVSRHERYTAVNDIYWEPTPAGRALLSKGED